MSDDIGTQAVMDYRDPAVLRELYVERGLSTRAVADKLDTSKTTIRRWLDRNGIDTRPSPSEKPPWFGLDGEGYERWNAETCDGSETVFVHRLAAVAWFGYDAVAGHHVHHSNGVPWDTRESNVEILTPGEHARHHATITARDRDRDERGRFK